MNGQQSQDIAYGLLPLLLDQEYIESNISNSQQRIELPGLYQAQIMENKFLFKTPDYASNSKSCDDNYEKWTDPRDGQDDDID
jgi:hypothetical protein